MDVVETFVFCHFLSRIGPDSDSKEQLAMIDDYSTITVLDIHCECVQLQLQDCRFSLA